MSSATDLAPIAACIQLVPDFPTPGILFRDITPLLLNTTCLQAAINYMRAPISHLTLQKIVGLESRGFLFAALLLRFFPSAGLVLARKPGKLPCPVIRADFELEYGRDGLEIHKDAISPGESVLIVDDVLATGGTAKAAYTLVEQAQGKVVAFSFLLAIPELKGALQLPAHIPVHSVLH